MYCPLMSFTSGAQTLQSLIGMSLMTVQFGSTAPTDFHGPRMESDVNVGMPEPVEKTKYFLLVGL